MSAPLDHELEPFLTPAMASKALGGIAIQTLARWRSDGTGPTYLKLGGVIRYRRADLQQWITASEVRSIEGI